MRARNSVITAQGILSLIAITVMLGYAGHALQLVPRDYVEAYAQDRQPAASTTQQTGPEAGQLALFAGTIVQNGSSFLLRGPSGAVYRLDDSTRAHRFAGLAVKVTGKLDSTLKVIRVEKIEETRT